MLPPLSALRRPARWTLSVLLTLVAALAPLTVVLLPHWPALLIWIFGPPTLLAAWLAGSEAPRLSPRLLLLLLLPLLWALASALWAFEPGSAAFLALRIFATLALGLLLAEGLGRLPLEVLQPAFRWFLPGFALAWLVLLEERLSGLFLLELVSTSPLSSARLTDHLIRSALGLALLAFAAGYILQARGPRWAVPALFAALFATLLAFPSSTALLGLALALPLLFVSLRRPRLGRGLLLAALLLALAAMPLLIAALGPLELWSRDWLGVTARARAYIWDFTLDRILERPFFGWGMDAAPNIPNFGVEPFFRYETKVIPLHPHSAGLQLWLDLGLVGVLLLLPLVLALWRGLAALPPRRAAYRIALAAMLLVAASLSFGLWQSRWVGLALLAFLILRLAERALGRPDPVSSRP